MPGLNAGQEHSSISIFDALNIACVVLHRFALQSTDQELLNFGQESEDELDSDEEVEEGGEGPAGEGEQGLAEYGQQQKLGGVTLAMVEGWCQAARDNASIGAVRNIMKVRQPARDCAG